MDSHPHNFTDRMAAGRRNADRRRARGLGTGGPGTVKWQASNYAPVDLAGHAHGIATTVAAMRDATTDAIEQYRFDVNGSDWTEGFA